MEFKISYNEPEGLHLNTVSIVGDFNDWTEDTHKLSKDENGVWSISLELSPGTYKYRFLINNSFTLNDPSANIYLPNEYGVFMSVIIIDDSLQRMYNPNTYSVEIDDFTLTNDINEFYEEKNTNLFFVPQDDKIVCRLDFSSVTGVHTISVLWYTPDMELFDVNETILWQPDDATLPIMLWFWIDSVNNPLKSGTWMIKFFLDGSFIFEDKFVIDMTDDLIIEMIKSRDSFFVQSTNSVPNKDVIVDDNEKYLDIVSTINNLEQISQKSHTMSQPSLSTNIIDIDNLVENLYENVFKEIESLESQSDTNTPANNSNIPSETDLVDTIDILDSISDIPDESDQNKDKEDKPSNNDKHQLPDI